MSKTFLLVMGVVMALAAGCVHDDLVDCGDGTSCPAETVCHALGCLAPIQLRECAGAAELASCSTDRIENGVCGQGACMPRGCGNSIVELGEQCDDGNRVDRDGCSGNCLSTETCGNNFLDTLMGELCDDGNLVSGDGCQADCDLPRCGDSVIDKARNEQCDDGMQNSDSAPDACRADCRTARCGDGVIDSNEQCDDANTLNTDSCRTDCVLPSCGNKVLDQGEECDDGNVVSNDGCQYNCRFPSCGDHIVDTLSNESCDEGALNSNAPDAICRDDCRPRRCGDGITDPGANEQCDQANSSIGDGCRPDCTIEMCGDGIVDTARGEDCDDMNLNNVDGCRNDCKRARCGDAIVDAVLFEECDLGDAMNSNNPNATCRTSCRLATCGDTIVDTLTEQCDQGNHTAGDGCSPTCKLEVCGNGIVDPPNEQCDDGNASNGDTCHTTCKVPKCGDGIVDPQINEECDLGTSNSNLPGAQCRTNCRVPICGDTVVDPGEVCDDGNLQAGDGCSSDCRSNETCGNRYLDLARGEECDDGSVMSHDGCSSRCVLEYPRWEDLTPAKLTPRARHAAVYDAARKRIVLFGGAPPPPATGPATLLGDTWEYDGVSWVQRRPTAAPSARMDAAMAYDSKRGLVFLFGGIAANGQRLSDLWMWNGVTWSPVSFVGGNSPTARSDAAFTFSPRTGTFVLFGGRTAAGFLGDTWALSPSGWSLLQSPGPGTPPARSGAQIAYDPRFDKIVLEGGEDVNGPLKDTWVFSAGQWNQGTDGPNRRFGTLAFDPSSNMMFLVGGRDGSLVTEVYTWDGSSWQMAGTIDCGGIENHTLTPMFDKDSLVLAGGTDDKGIPIDRVWTTRNATMYMPASASLGPTARAGAGAAYDPSRGVTVMYGGASGGSTILETWEWNGLSWSSRGAGPLGAYHPSLVFSPTNRAMLAVGGGRDATCGDASDETSAWNGTAWTQVSTGDFGAVCAASTTFEPKGGVPIAIGGYDPGAAETRSTGYQWDGSRWNAHTELDMLKPIDGPSLAFDPHGGRVMQFGDSSRADFMKSEQELWEWIGSWTVYKYEVGAPPRGRNATIYDPNRGGITVFGGEGLGGPLDDIWFLNQGRWQQLPVNVPINYGSEAPVIVYHAATSAFVALSPPTGLNTTYALRYESRTPDEACLEGIDRDGDGKLGLDDPDCWTSLNSMCTPCLYGTCSPCMFTSCGDGACGAFEDGRTCPTDCGAITPKCGDHHCDGGENCPGDCP